jgi:hypothetical protein
VRRNARRGSGEDIGFLLARLKAHHSKEALAGFSRAGKPTSRGM